MKYTENQNPLHISGPRKFSLLAVSMQRDAGQTWFEIICNWLADWILIPIEVAFNNYSMFGSFLTWMIRGHLRCNPYNWWSLPPNWCAEWSARIAWGKNWKQNSTVNSIPIA